MKKRKMPKGGVGDGRTTSVDEVRRNLQKAAAGGAGQNPKADRHLP